MVLDEDKAMKLEYKGKTYYFCGAGCRDRFERNPEGYLEGHKDWIAGD